MKAIVVVICGLALTGCASRGYRFDGVGGDGSLVPAVSYILESEDGREGTVVVSAHGRAYEEVEEGWETDVVRIRIVLDNLSHDPLAVPLDDVLVFDDEGRAWGLLRTTGPQGVETDLHGPPGTRSTYDLLFDGGAPGALRTTGSISLDWAYRFRGIVIRHRTRFLPVRVERSSVVWGTGFWYGYHPGWCW
jgi:hypothetical protein